MGGASQRGLAGREDVASLVGEKVYLLSNGCRFVGLQLHQLHQPLPLFPLLLALPSAHLHTLRRGKDHHTVTPSHMHTSPLTMFLCRTLSLASSPSFAVLRVCTWSNLCVFCLVASSKLRLSATTLAYTGGEEREQTQSFALCLGKTLLTCTVHVSHATSTAALLELWAACHAP